MNQNNIKSFETEAFRLRLSKLAESKTVEDAAFADAVYTALSKFGIDEDKFRDAFGLSKGAVDRWTQRQIFHNPRYVLKY